MNISNEAVLFEVVDISNGTTLPEVTKINNETSINKCPTLEIIQPIIATAIVLSVVCLIITIIVYILVSESKTLHGKILISLSACLGTMYSLLFLAVYLQPYLTITLCVTMGTVTYIMFIATFYWLNVMTYDLWKTVSSTTASTNSRHSKKYLRYSAYAWTSTIITCIPMIIVQNTNLVPEKYHPGIGEVSCWFKGYTAPLIYMSIPIGIILFSNIVMFILTTKTLVQIDNMTQKFQLRQNKIQFKLYLKLFLIMGLSWMTDFIPSMFDNCHIYLITDTFNALHGLFLFLIFICKKKILKPIFDFCKIRGCASLCKKSSFHLDTGNLEEYSGSKGSFSTSVTDI
ncbi:G-protein coupled receptor Mth2-like [Centruroides sculpturatus]|uniref:G-protein coupled receptor Mth2-like n=1 Tax=Centruroides sculpturatus TaxID=218467 RepID=UPI000C6DD204|nr:G-protein coupled receptor Mth2-like [Centruroides sculpturatus]